MRAPITAIMTQAAGGTFAADHQASVWGHCADEKFSELIHRAPHPCCHCQQFKLPVRSDNRHSHSHASRPATRNLTLPILAMPFHDDDGALGQQSSTRRHLLSDPGGSLRLCFHWGCPRAHSFLRGPLQKTLEFRQYSGASGLPVNLFATSPFRTPTPFVLAMSRSFAARHNRPHHTLLSLLSCGLSHSRLTHDDHPGSLRHPASWPFGSLTSPPMIFSFTPPWSSTPPNSHPGPSHL